MKFCLVVTDIHLLRYWLDNSFKEYKKYEADLLRTASYFFVTYQSTSSIPRRMAFSLSGRYFQFRSETECLIPSST